MSYRRNARLGLVLARTNMAHLTYQAYLNREKAERTADEKYLEKKENPKQD